ncbi:MAG: hypothetical protein JW759_10535 [Candidatus Coatesbacteria bacterium]|nr:hypothetical protein [Candidatus Coatesbacteria bacterium]
MRNSLIASLIALFVLTCLAFGQEYNEVFSTGWLPADENGDGTPEWGNMFMTFLRDINGDGNADFSIIKSSDTYYTDWTTTHADFYGADFTPFWTIEDASVAPLYLSYADIDGDGKIEMVFTGRSDEDTDLTRDIITSLVEVYQVGSQVPEWDRETDQGVQVIGLTGPALKFDDDATPDLLLLGDWFRSFDSYLFRSTAANTYELLWQSQGNTQSRILVQVDYDFDGDYEVLLCEDEGAQESRLRLYDYDPGTERMVSSKVWYRDELFVIPDQVCDINGDGSPELLVRTYNSLRQSYDLKLFNADSEQGLFSFGELLLDDSITSGAVFWEDGLDGHDLNHDGNPEILYMATQYEEDTQGVNRISERSAYVKEYQNGTFVTRFAQDPSLELKGVEVCDLDADGTDELCLSFFIRVSSSAYRYETIVYDPMNGYQEKFRIVLQNHQLIPYTQPLTYYRNGLGVDIDGDGVGEFMTLDYEWVTQTEGQYKVQIRDGATGAIEWEKQYGRGVYVSVDWAEGERTIGGIIYPSTDFDHNGKLNFGVSESQVEDEELVAAKYTIFEPGIAAPKLDIWVDTDKSSYGPGNSIDLKIGGQNTGMATVVDIYVAIVRPDGAICCAPSFEPGISPWITGFVFPGGFSMQPATFWTWTLPYSPIETPGNYLLAGALTPPGQFTFLDLEVADFTYGLL